MSPLLRAEHISVRFDGVHAVTDVSLTLSAGEIVVLIGPNGSGKSTLLRSLLGLVPGGGLIAWDEKPLDRWDRRALARRVAYLPQEPLHEPGQTVRQVLRLGRAPYWSAFGLEGLADDAAVERVFGELHLPDRPLEQLSGGQRQRVFVGRCLAQEPAALLLDEPDTFLDLRHAAALRDQIRRLAKQQNLAILCTSHDLNAAAALADRLLLMNDGRLAAAGDPRQVLQAELLSDVFGVALERIDRPGRPPLIVPRSADSGGATAGE